jgi:hypothetical protein
MLSIVMESNCHASAYLLVKIIHIETKAQFHAHGRKEQPERSKSLNWGGGGDSDYLR